MSLQNLIVLIALLVVLGQFLDSQLIENQTKERIRTRFIEMYIWLYETPSKVRSVISNYRERGYESDQVRSLRKQRGILEKLIYGRLYWLLIVPVISIVLGLLFQWIYKEPTLHNPLQIPREASWWWSLFFGFLIAMMLPLLLATIVTFVVVIMYIPVLVCLLITEIIRRLALVTLDKASNPRTSPFSYFTALLAVLAALFTAIQRIFLGGAAAN
jgi:hypothetical protein